MSVIASIKCDGGLFGCEATFEVWNKDGSKVQILGSNLWGDAAVLKLPALQGAWFAATETAGFSGFAQRYRAKFGSEPARVATLSCRTGRP